MTEMNLSDACLSPRRAAAVGVPVVSWLRSALPGLALALAGVLILHLGRGQPAWFGAQVGPGLMAQILGKGVIGLGAAWAVWRMLRPDPVREAGCAPGDTTDAQPWSGPALLGAVLLFALAVPQLGLVAAITLAAALAAWGAGERHLGALLLTVLGLAGLTIGIVLMLLPPTAPLWPAFWSRF